MSRRTRELLKENNELEKQMKLEDREILTDIVVYIRSVDISPYYQEMVRRDIWQMLLDGETMGMTADEVLGGDYRSFCDQVIRELPHLTGKEKLISSLRDVLLSVVVLMVIWFCFGMTDLLSGDGSLPYFGNPAVLGSDDPVYRGKLSDKLSIVSNSWDCCDCRNRVFGSRV